MNSRKSCYSLIAITVIVILAFFVVPRSADIERVNGCLQYKGYEMKIINSDRAQWRLLLSNACSHPISFHPSLVNSTDSIHYQYAEPLMTQCKFTQLQPQETREVKIKTTSASTHVGLESVGYVDGLVDGCSD